MQNCLQIIDDIKSSGVPNLERAILISAQLIMKKSLTKVNEDKTKLNNAVDLICKLREKEKEREIADLSKLDAEATAAAASGFSTERRQLVDFMTGNRGGKSRRIRRRRRRRANSKSRRGARCTVF